MSDPWLKKAADQPPKRHPLHDLADTIEAEYPYTVHRASLPTETYSIHLPQMTLLYDGVYVQVPVGWLYDDLDNAMRLVRKQFEILGAFDEEAEEAEVDI